MRTNLRNKDPAELWRTYVQLTEVEAAFRALKSELAIRPLYHQLERRVQTHILVGVESGRGRNPTLSAGHRFLGHRYSPVRRI